MHLSPQLFTVHIINVRHMMQDYAVSLANLTDVNKRTDWFKTKLLFACSERF